MDNTIDTPLGKITLRAAREGDLAAFRELRLEALQENPASFGSDYAVNKAQPKEFWVGRLNLEGENGKFYFATHKDELVGMCGIMLGTSPKTRHNGTIVSVYVKRDWQGQHIARELIELCAGWGREHEVRLLKLAVVANNASAIRCYTGCGFSVYGIDPQAICFEGKYYDELLMVQQLI
jgi:RimJ/RimL family protein N-acetyltransferase